MNRPYVLYTDFHNDLPQGEVAGAIDRVHHAKTGEDPHILYDYKDVKQWSIDDGALHSHRIAETWKHRDPVHVAVIDPTVGFEGCERIAVDTERAGTLVGPNNGIFDLTIRDFGVKYAAVIDESLRTIPREQSNTFDGRDLFAPAAAELATGAKASDIGKELPHEKLRSLHWSPGQVVHEDGFGNLKVWELDAVRQKIGETMNLRSREGTSTPASIVHHHSEAEEGDLIILPGSSGLAEIWVVWGSARERLGYTVGDMVAFDEKSVCHT